VQGALNACTSGQAVELVPGASGQRAFVLAPWNLPSGVRVIIDAGVYVLASRALSDWGGSNCGLVTTGTSFCNHWITAPSSSGSGIYGYGTLNGRGWASYLPPNAGQSFYGNRIQAYINLRGSPQHGSPNGTPNGAGNNSYGPNAVNLVGANDFTMYKVTVKDSGNFLVNWTGNGFLGWGVKLIAPFEVANTDGWDPLNATNGTLTKSYISNGDNQTAIKADTSQTSNITVSNSQMGAGIGLAIGSATQYGISNILFTGNVQNGNLYNDQSTGLQIGSSTSNGGLVNQVTYQNHCMFNEQNSIRFYTNYGCNTGTNTPIYKNIYLQNINVLGSTAPYTTGLSGNFTWQGLSGNPILSQIDGLAIQGTNQGIAQQCSITTDQYSTAYLGAVGGVHSSVLTQFAAGTQANTTGTAGSGGAYPCTTSMWSPLVGELNIKTPASNNNQTYNNTGATTYTIQAVLEPTTEISTKEQPALTAPLTFLDNGTSIGTASLIGDGTYAFITPTVIAGTHVYTASYPGDSFYPAFSFGSVTVTNPTSGTPPQFAALLTDSNDYVCAGILPCSTWPMPAIPAAGSSYTDPTWGTKQYRLTVSPSNASNQVIPCYSRVQSWNADDTKFMMAGLAGDYVNLYDATTTPPTPINQISTTLGVGVYPDCIDSDAYFGNTTTDKNIIYFQGSSGTAYGLSLMSVDISTCTSSSCTLTPTVIQTFSCTTDSISNPELGAGVAGNKIETGSGGQGGLFDQTDTYFTFSCDKVDGAGTHKIDVIRYNKSTGATTQQKWYTLCPGGQPAGCAAYWNAGQTGKNIFRMSQHQDHRFISLLWQAGSSNGVSGTSSPPTHINITGNVLTVTAANSFKVGTEAKFHSLSAATYLNNVFVLITSATSTQFTAVYPHANDDQAITSGTITGLSCSLDVNWVQGCGVEIFSDTYTFLGAAAAYSAHQDTGFDVYGNPVLVEVGSHRNDTADSRALGISNMLTLSTTAPNQNRILLPCSYDRTTGCGTGTYRGAKAGATHVNMTGTWGATPGYAEISTMMNAGSYIPQTPDFPLAVTLGTAVTPGTFTVFPASMANIGVGIVSTIDTGAGMESVIWTAVTGTSATAVFTKSHTATAAVYCLSCGDAGWGAMENIAVKIDATAADGSSASFWRLGRDFAIRDNTYDAEPHTTVNRDFTQMVWGSTWNVDPADASTVYGYWLKIP
jgi:polygalacturonase